MVNLGTSLRLLPKKRPTGKKIGHSRVCPFLKNGDQNSEKTEKLGCW